MRALRSRQTGMGVLSWLVVLAVASFFLTCFFRVGPVYLDYWQIKKSLDNVLTANRAQTMGKQELVDAIQNNFDVSLIRTVRAQNFKFKETREGRELDATYEQRVPLIANIDVVVKFDNLKYKLSGAQ